LLSSLAISFFTPYFFFESFHAFASIPPAIIKPWFYPVNQNSAEPTEEEHQPAATGTG